MKISVIAIAILLALCSADINQKKDVICSIELSVVKSKKFGQLLSIVGKLENRSNRKLYFDKMHLRIDIMKKVGKELIDFNESWFSYEVANKDRDEIAEEVRDTSRRLIFNRSTHEFTDSLAKAFYHDLISDKRFVKSTKDSIVVKDWMMLEFEQLAFVDPQQNCKEMKRINSLPPGSYMFVVSYDNTKQIAPRLPHLTLPKELNGYEIWKGIAVSDTLRLSVK